MASNPALFARISNVAARLDARWLAHCRTRRSLRISNVSVRPASSLAGHEHYGSLYGITYYNFKVATGEPYRAGPLAAEERLEEWLAKGFLTYCTCDDVIIAFWTSLEKRLRMDEDFIGMQAKCALIQPRVVFFGQDDKLGREAYYEHTYIIMEFKGGVKLVLDLTGYQFGYSKRLYTLREFEGVMFGGGAENGDDVDVDAIIEGNEERAMGEIEVGDSMQMHAMELLDLSFDDDFLYN